MGMGPPWFTPPYGTTQTRALGGLLDANRCRSEPRATDAVRAHPRLPATAPRPLHLQSPSLPERPPPHAATAMCQNEVVSLYLGTVLGANYNFPYAIFGR